MTYLEELNEDQLKSVQTTEGYLRVIAGAGSGKTKLLVSRYVYLVTEYGINPANILCVTFTNKAAREMKQRIKRLLGEEFDSPFICTYHGFCARVLRDDCDKIFYPKNFQILDTDGQKAILEDVYQKHELKLDHAAFEKMLKKISQVKSGLFYVSCFCNAQPCSILPAVATLDDEIIEEYLQRQKSTYALDFQDLLNFTLYLFYNKEEILKKWQDKLNYIQVDEFQDSSQKEMELIDMLSQQYKNLMIVGDPDQNIYEWRGSDVTLLVDFDRSHEGCQTQFLTKNYRSTSRILQCANTLIAKNKFRLEKDLYTDNGDGEEVCYYHEKNEYDEAARIADSIHRLKAQKGYRYSDFAVLYRSGFLSWVIERKLNELGIPYEIYGGIKFYQRMEIQDVIAYLRLITYDDDTAFKRIVNKPRRRFGKVKMKRLFDLQEPNVSLFDTLREHLDDDVIQKSDAAEFVRLILDMRQKSLLASVPDMVSAVCAESGYEGYIRELGDMDRFDNLSEFKRIAEEQDKSEGEPLSLEEFLGRIALQINDDDSDEQDNVKLMTVHAAKGLEFPVVFVMGLSEGVFPSSKTFEERGDLGLEEERRLCYVAITRARERLFLSESEGTTPRGARKKPSRFLYEIGAENYRQFGVVPQELQSYAVAPSTGRSAEKAQYGVGEKVIHPIFGEGVVKGVTGHGTNYRIEFPLPYGERDISAAFFGSSPLKALPREQTPQAEKSLPPVQSKPAPPTPKREKENAPEQMQMSLSFGEVPPAPLPQEKKQPTYSYGGSGADKPKAPVRASDETKQFQFSSEPNSETGWRCVGISDLGKPSAVCGLCLRMTVRYLHHMSHLDGRRLNVGCVCAGKLEGNNERAKEREADFKNKLARQANFAKRKLSTSRNGNLYLKYNGHVLVVLEDKYQQNLWRYVLDGDFSQYAYASISDLLADVFWDMEK